MTEQWKPVPHRTWCPSNCSFNAACNCVGTREYGFGASAQDVLAVWALCEWFGKMREPLMPDDYIAVPVAAWQEMVDELEKAKPSSSTFMQSPACLEILNRQFLAFRCAGDD